MQQYRYYGPELRRLTVFAQDPAVTANGKALTTQVLVPAEAIEPGPKGHRAHVIDYDTSTGTHYAPRRPFFDKGNGDPYAKTDDRDKLVADPHFHQQNVYGIVMATLLEFETALGRHIKWCFDYGSHQIKIAPHAFADANAFYSRRDEGLMFGYFPAPDRKENIFTCLSYDIVAHETTHAVLDGLRKQFDRPSSPDQAAFHEGFADIVALLSVLRGEEMIAQALRTTGAKLPQDKMGRYRIDPLIDALGERSFLFGLAEEMGKGLKPLNRDALRRSIRLAPSDKHKAAKEFQEAHRRGEIVAAAVLTAFLKVWADRLSGKVSRSPQLPGAAAALTKYAEPWRVVEEGAKSAAHLLRMAIRAIDYMPPVDMEFGDFLSALITADHEACPDDKTYHYRDTLLAAFAAYGIEPASSTGAGRGLWQPPENELTYGHAHFDPMRWDTEAVFRFVWENRKPLGLYDDAFTMVQSVRPVVRIGTDGFVLRETVVEYFQLVDLLASELAPLKIRKPNGMAQGQPVRLYGGGTLIFDEYGHVKYHVGNGVRSKSQSGRLEQLWLRGAFAERSSRKVRRFARLHLDRAANRSRLTEEQL